MSEEFKTEPKKQDIELELQLGDVIHITNPVNENLNEQTFFIDYIDRSKAYLINTDTLNRIKIKISEDDNCSTFGINVGACAPYAADFDGDAVNIMILNS